MPNVILKPWSILCITGFEISSTELKLLCKCTVLLTRETLADYLVPVLAHYKDNLRIGPASLMINLVSSYPPFLGLLWCRISVSMSCDTRRGRDIGPIFWSVILLPSPVASASVVAELGRKTSLVPPFVRSFFGPPARSPSPLSIPSSKADLAFYPQKWNWGHPSKEVYGTASIIPNYRVSKQDVYQIWNNMLNGGWFHLRRNSLLTDPVQVTTLEWHLFSVCCADPFPLWWTSYFEGPPNRVSGMMSLPRPKAADNSARVLYESFRRRRRRGRRSAARPPDRKCRWDDRGRRNSRQKRTRVGTWAIQPRVQTSFLHLRITELIITQ